MRVRGPLAVALAALIVAAPAAAGRCHPRRSKTLAANAQVRVFSVKHGRSSLVFGCLRSSGRRIRVIRNLDDSGGLSGDTISEVLVAGTSVALVQDSFADFGVEGEQYETIVVDDLAKGGRRFRRQVTEDDGDLYETIVSTDLRADGTAAWTLATQTDKYVEVDLLRARARRPTPLAFARGIDAASLVLTSTAVSWKQDGTRRSVAVP